MKALVCYQNSFTCHVANGHRVFCHSRLKRKCVYFNSSFWIEMKLVLISIHHSELKWNLFGFQFFFLNWNETCFDFNSSFWIEMKLVLISIHHSELKSKLFGFQFFFLNWTENCLDFKSSFWIELKTDWIQIHHSKLT